MTVKKQPRVFCCLPWYFACAFYVLMPIFMNRVMLSADAPTLTTNSIQLPDNIEDLGRQVALLENEIFQSIASHNLNEAGMKVANLTPILFAKEKSINKASQPYTARINLIKEELSMISENSKTIQDEYSSVYEMVSDSRKQIVTYKYAETELLLKQSLSLLRKPLISSKTLFTQSLIHKNLGTLYAYTRRYDKALINYTEYSNITKIILGINHPDYIMSVYYMGITSLESKDLHNAEVHLRNYLSAERLFSGSKSMRYQIGLAALSAVLYKKQLLPDAESLSLLAISIADLHGKSKSASSALSYLNLADINTANGEYKEAENNYIKSINTYTAIDFPNPASIIEALERYGLFLKNAKREDELVAVNNKINELKITHTLPDSK